MVWYLSLLISIQNNRYLENTKWWQKSWNILIYWNTPSDQISTNIFTALSSVLSSIFISFTAFEWYSVLILIPSCFCRWEFCVCVFLFSFFLPIAIFLLIFFYGISLAERDLARIWLDFFKKLSKHILYQSQIKAYFWKAWQN